MVDHNEVKRISRREFLYYLWSAGAGLLGIGACGTATWFAIPHLAVGKELFVVQASEFPTYHSPKVYRKGNFYLNMLDGGLVAFDAECTLRDENVKWVPTNHRFECPNCGSKYQIDGKYISGPAPRNLDRIVFYATTIHGDTIQTPNDGAAVDITDVTKIVVNRLLLIKTPRIEPTPFWY